MRTAKAACVLLIAVAGLQFLCSRAGAALASSHEYPPLNIVMLRSSPVFTAAAISQDQQMRETVERRTTRNVHFHIEILDTLNFDAAEIEKEFLSMFHKKYRDRPIDLFVAVGIYALRLAQRYRENLIPGVPILFYDVAEDAIEGYPILPGVTGVLLKFDVAGTLDLAVRLQPQARRIVVIGGQAAYDRNWFRRAREALAPYENKLEVLYWNNYAAPEMLENVKRLEPDTIVLFLSMVRDAAGQHFLLRNIVKQVAEVSRAPVYAVIDTAFGQGIVGGVMPSFPAHGRLAGELAARLLTGETASSIPLQTSSSAAMIDWRQLRKWNMDGSLLPKGALVLYREPTLWSQYRGYVVGAAALIGLQGLLIGGLVLQRSSRRRAELELRESELRFRKMADTAPVLIWTSGRDKLCDFFNQNWLDFTGRTLEEELGNSWTAGVHPEDLQHCLDVYYSSFDARKPFEMEYRLRRRDGEYRWILDRGVPRYAPNNEFVGYIGSCIDITDLKRTQERNEELVHHLGERVKELTALHRAARILQNEAQPLPDLLQQFVAVLPPAWQYPEITAARIRLGELEFATPNFKQTSWMQRADFSLAEGLQGVVEVVYLEEKPPEQDGPFLAEEQNLIDSMAELLRSAVERRQVQEEVSLLQTIAMEVGAADDLSSALKVVLRHVCEKTGWLIGQAWIPRPDGSVLDCSPAWFTIAPGLEKFRRYSEATTFPRGGGLPGRVWSSKQPAWRHEATLDMSFPRAQVAAEVGLDVALAIPIVSGSEVLAVIEFFTREKIRSDEQLVKLITTVAAQLGLVIERKRAAETLRKNETVLRESYDRIQDLAGRLITAQEAERSRIAGELHDDVNQQLAGLSIALSNVKRQLHNGANGTVQEEITRLQQRTIDLANVIRSLSHELHPGVLQHAGLVAALKGHCEEFGAQHAIEVTLSAADNLEGISDNVALCLYRVAQEALRNIAEHAGAHKAEVTLRTTEAFLELIVADDGRGFELAEVRSPGGLGLISLDERVRLIGGRLSISTQPQRGAELRVQVPLGGNQ
jgi:PAS domain S-box-containing protein